MSLDLLIKDTLTASSEESFMFKNLYVASFISFSWTSAKEMQMFYFFVTFFFTVSVLCLIIEAEGGTQRINSTIVSLITLYCTCLRKCLVLVPVCLFHQYLP